jgi:hypothetical protein
MIGYFCIGALGALLTTEMAKYKIGRLRPYFLTVCNVSLTDGLCKDKFGYNKFVDVYSCTGDATEVRYWPPTSRRLFCYYAFLSKYKNV